MCYVKITEEIWKRNERSFPIYLEGIIGKGTNTYIRALIVSTTKENCPLTLTLVVSNVGFATQEERTFIELFALMGPMDNDSDGWN